jgi:ubiquinone/menaquinone biosynthesis C-methylase UbiE
MSYLVPSSIDLDTDDAQDELDRMDFEHHIFKLLLDGRLHLNPLEHPQRILDLGTGTGIWAIEMADQYPSASIIGTDLSPVQPSLSV